MSQSWNAQQYRNHAAFVAEYGSAIFDMLAPQTGEKILDLGCGDGALTEQISRTGAKVLGVDTSKDMVLATRQRGLAAQQLSGEALCFEQEFDAVFSNAALHWMTAAEKVTAGVARALKPGGRFVGEFGGYGNVSTILTAMQSVFDQHRQYGAFNNPWYFPTAEQYRELLSQSGFDVRSVALIPRPTVLDSGLKRWLQMFTGDITVNLSNEQRNQLWSDVEQHVRDQLFVDKQWTADYVRLRFYAVKR